MKTPLRGEVWLVDLGLAAKVRPALVLSGLLKTPIVHVTGCLTTAAADGGRRDPEPPRLKRGR